MDASRRVDLSPAREQAMNKPIWFQIPVAALIASTSLGEAQTVCLSTEPAIFVKEFVKLDLKMLPFEVSSRGSCGCRLKKEVLKDRDRKNG